MLHPFLFFFLVPHKATEKQIISPSTQIIGGKPQTVSGPPWVIIHPTVVLTLMMVSCAICNSDLDGLALSNGITAPGWEGGVGGGTRWGGVQTHLTFRGAAVSFYTFWVVLTPGGGGGKMGERDRLFYLVVLQFY